ncbi:MAG: phosphoenolpyruvate carboxylase [Woeseiaceae bacterium]|nr:phosphoenolpyruvate carboxylase [Woeseiaceae bacterium]
MIMRRQDIVFEDKDQPLRDDVRTLGALVGSLIREQGGEELFDFVETARVRAIRRREGNDRPGETLSDLTEGQAPDFATEVIRSFSTYFQIVNTAEKVHRIRRRREHLKNAGDYQPGGFEDMLLRLKADGIDRDGLQKILDHLHIEPVFTAHPTEPTRRTILRKEQHIVRRLVDMLNPTMTAQEKRASLANIRLEVTTGWQTEEHPSERMSVADELEHVLFFLTDILYRVVPAFYEDIENSAIHVYGEEGRSIEVPNFLHFGSWVGGDMDGNPNVNAKTIRSTMARQRALILDLYYNECASLATKLSQSQARISVSDDVMAKIEEYQNVFPNAFHAVPARHRDMPYRVLLRLIQERLQATYDDDAYPYESARQLEADVSIIADSLRQNKGEHAGLFAVKRLLRRIGTFGFHMATLDVRQDSMVHREVIGECLGIDDWLDWPADKRAARITEAIRSKESPPLQQSILVRKTLGVFQAISFCRRKYGRAAIGPFIVSMTQGVDDLLSVLLLANWSELHTRRGDVPLDVAPLLETVDDLKKAPAIMQSLLDSDLYREHLDYRNNEQVVMIGYSDSNKDSGLASARWALHRAQLELVASVKDKPIKLRLFHGRGGTVSRGGSKTHIAVLGSPPGTVEGYLRVTEQGEIINEKYGLRAIALRTFEQTAGAVAIATALPDHRGADSPEWHEMMQVVAKESRAAYRKLVYDTAGFYEYFRKATPIDLIERMRIGSRPPSRRGGTGVQDLRAIPWVFAWAQSRHMFPGWYGVGTGLKAAEQHFEEKAFRNMFREWYFMRAMTADVEVVLAKADLGIAEHYSKLAGKAHDRFFPIIAQEFELTRELVLKYGDHHELLEGDLTMQRAIMLRNPYVDPMSLMQVDLLQRWRDAQRKDDELLEALLASVNGIAAGLQNTG